MFVVRAVAFDAAAAAVVLANAVIAFSLCLFCIPFLIVPFVIGRFLFRFCFTVERNTELSVSRLSHSSDHFSFAFVIV